MSAYELLQARMAALECRVAALEEAYGELRAVAVELFDTLRESTAEMERILRR